MNTWYKDAVFYGIDVGSFQDSNGDGIGDFPGLISRLPYLAELGITGIWLLPFYLSPHRDNGYDVKDYYTVDPRYGTLEDFIAFIRNAGEHGIRVIVDLVVHHTSDEHPWFQAARHDRNSRYYRYYVWSDTVPSLPPGAKTIFPGEEHTLWTYDETAKAYFYHHFYHFQPQLRFSNPEVVNEVYRIMDYWLSFGVSGFRIDAASRIVESLHEESMLPAAPHRVLREMRRFLSSRHEEAVFLAESDVRVAALEDYFGAGDEMNMLFNFVMSEYSFLAMARHEAAPIYEALGMLPTIPQSGQWLNFLRNLDELDLEQLPGEGRAAVFEVFAPDSGMRIFDRGIRRRLAPMLEGDPARIRMALSLVFALPGSPIIMYGDEIGLGENLSLPGRNAVRTPMQWSGEPYGGFSTAGQAHALEMPTDRKYGFKSLNAASQERDPDSLLSWTKRLIRVRKSSPELGWGSFHPIRADSPSVLALHCRWRGTQILTLHNFSEEPVRTVLDLEFRHFTAPGAVLESDAELVSIERSRLTVSLGPYGCLWLRAGSPDRGGSEG